MHSTFKWIGGATWILTIDDCVIACDPVLCREGHVQDYGYFKTKRLNDPAYDTADFDAVNLWLLTHNHEDHLDADGLKAIRRDAAIASHESFRRLLVRKSYDGARYLAWGEETSFQFNGIDVAVKAVPAIHAKKRFISGMIGNGNGYLLRIAGHGESYRVYVTGDSVYSTEIIGQIGDLKPDLIIANAGSAMVGKSPLASIIGRITNNILDVKRMCREMRPELLIPVHWGTFSHYAETITTESFDASSPVKIVAVGERVELAQGRRQSGL